MEKRKTIFDYLVQALASFGFTVAVFLGLTLLFGNMAQEESTLFSLGSRGLALSSLAQILLLNVCIVFLRFLFFTETIIRKAGVVTRTAAMISCSFVLMILFVVLFRWFPADLPLAWLSFIISCAVCFLLSLLVCAGKDRLENKRMAEALSRMKNSEGGSP